MRGAARCQCQTYILIESALQKAIRRICWSTTNCLLNSETKSSISEQQRLERSVEQMERTLKHELSAEQMHPAQLKVLSSLQNHWSGLRVFLKHPQVALDNNSGERKLRNPAMLRKNCRGSGSHWSASLAAQMFSIIQTVL